MGTENPVLGMGTKNPGVGSEKKVNFLVFCVFIYQRNFRILKVRAKEILITLQKSLDSMRCLSKNLIPKAKLKPTMDDANCETKLGCMYMYH